MDYEKKIDIPDGFEATIEGNTIILKKAESEDERIRKALLEMVHDTTGDELWIDYNVHKEDALAWLEKQGEQKSVDDLTQQEAMGIAVAKCFESRGVCTNPLIDCNDCLKRFGDGSTITTSQTILKKEE